MHRPDRSAPPGPEALPRPQYSSCTGVLAGPGDGSGVGGHLKLPAGGQRVPNDGHYGVWSAAKGGLRRRRSRTRRLRAPQDGRGAECYVTFRTRELSAVTPTPCASWLLAQFRSPGWKDRVQNQINEAEIAQAAERLGVAGRAMCVHASLRSFPRLTRGPATLIDGLLSTGATVMVATMAGEAFAITAPPDDRPARNAIDYRAMDRQAAVAPWPGLADIFQSPTGRG